MWRRYLGGLSGRLVVLTILFVMLAEALIFVPSVSRYRRDYLQERIDNAQIAALSALVNPQVPLTEALQKELLDSAGVCSIVFRREHLREVMLAISIKDAVIATYDLTQTKVMQFIAEGLQCVFACQPGLVRVIGMPSRGEQALIEVVIDQTELREAMLDYGLRILWLSLFISGLTAVLVFLTVRWALVKPMLGLVDSMTRFASDPEAPPLNRGRRAAGEIGIAELALAQMQTEVRNALHQKSHLAALGEAVAKISHDLRNLLATAQLFGDRLDSSNDPVVRAVGPKLLASLDRASKFCAATLEYGRAAEPAPVPRLISLSALVDDVGTSVPMGKVRFVNQVAPGTQVMADLDQLYRLLSNMLRNSQQAIEQTNHGSTVTISAHEEPGWSVIDIADDGPGLPIKARANLFRAFKSSTRTGGTGLGLTIAAEIARAHGGTLELLRSDTAGTLFRLKLPR